jgi:hypothetical protein
MCLYVNYLFLLLILNFHSFGEAYANQNCSNLFSNVWKPHSTSNVPDLLAFSLWDSPHGSISYRIGLKRFGDNQWRLPRAQTLNSRLDLIEGKSTIYFIEIDSYVVNATKHSEPGSIDAHTYLSLIADGYLGISSPITEESNTVSHLDMFYHDITVHVPGYYILSLHSHWPRLKQISRELIKAFDRTSEDILKSKLVDLRTLILHRLEDDSANITEADRKSRSYQIYLNNFSVGVEDIEHRWHALKPETLSAEITN